MRYNRGRMASTTRWIVVVLAAAGLAAAGTSTYVHYQLLTQPAFTSFCDVSSTVNCTEAYLSDYGAIAGVPVALAGVAYFGAVLLIALLAWRPSTPSRMHAPNYIFLLSLPALAVVGYLAYAAFFVLNAVCILCVITYVAVVGIAVASSRAMTKPVAALPLARDVRAASTSPLALLMTAAGVVVLIWAISVFPEKGVAAAAPAAATAALPAVSDVDRARLAEWWELQPRIELKGVDGGGAKVVVVKFNDYQCPPCRLTHEAYKPIFAKHGGNVKYVLKHFPLEGECNAVAAGGGHYAACEAAAAVLMARPRGTAEKMEEWLFTNQGPPQLTPDQVRAAARDVAGIPDFAERYPAVLADVRADAELGASLNVKSTPTFYINGRVVPQILEPRFFDVLIELELKRSGQ